MFRRQAETARPRSRSSYSSRRARQADSRRAGAPRARGTAAGAFFEPRDEPELLAELERLAGAAGKPDEPALTRALRDHALELMRFTPPGWSVEPSFFTLEGDPVAHGSAIWEVRDLAAARDRLRGLGGLRPGEPIEMDISPSRATRSYAVGPSYRPARSCARPA